MLYGNDSYGAIMAMERERTGNYGEDNYEDDEDLICPICGSINPHHAYLNRDDECVGCSDCLSEVYELEEMDYE